MRRLVNSDVDVTLTTFEKGNGAFVFIGDEFAGTIERDTLGWTGNAVYGTSSLCDGSMWGLVRQIIHIHALGSLLHMALI